MDDRRALLEAATGLPSMLPLAATSGTLAWWLTLWAPTWASVTFGVAVGLAVLARLVVADAAELSVDLAAGRCLRCRGDGDFYWSTGHVSVCPDCRGSGEL